MLEAYDLGFQYGVTCIASGYKYTNIDLGESVAEYDFFQFLVTLADAGEISMIKQYKKQAKKLLEKEYNLKDISESMVIAKSYILEMIEEKKWELYEEGANDALHQS
jgi:homoserine kinase